jgi:nitrate/nitrite-specific signal transduction histidine kinase
VPTILAKAFYKITECALETALAAPHCSLIDIYVKRSQGEYVLEIADNGNADDAASGSQPLRRLLMDYYASKSHVTLKIQRAPGKGGLVRASFPLPAANFEGGS